MQRQPKKTIQPIPPQFDDSGLNVFDPNDKKGFKTKYITLLHEIALLSLLPEGKGRIAVDVGCGYGRLTSLLTQKNWQTIGVDPSQKLLDYANAYYPQSEFRIGALPKLPVEVGCAGLLLLQNLLRLLHLDNKLDVVKGIGNYVQDEGYIVVVDNIRDNHPDYIPESKIISMIESEGFQLEKRVAIRAARWWLIYLIRYGFIPERWFHFLAQWELHSMAKNKFRPRWQYHNVLFIFRKVAKNIS